MRKFIFVIVLSSIIGSCSPNTKIEKEDFDIVIPDLEHEYTEVSEKIIFWEDIFGFDQEMYFVYFYSQTCSHCEEIKNEMIEKALASDNLYFVQSSNKNVLKNDVSFTIGVGNVGDFAILGYPSLVKIVNGLVVENVAGKFNIEKLINSL